MGNDIKDVLTAAIFALLIASVAVLLFIRISADKPCYSRMEYVVQDGDTLDGLYYRFGGGGLERWRYLVRIENDMNDSCLYTGEEIIVLRKGDGTNGK